MVVDKMEQFIDVSVMLRPGVYALVKRGVVIYVGKAKQLYSRIYTHRNVAGRAAKGQKIPTWMPVKGFVFDEVWVRPCRVEDLERLETEMINLYKPRFNESLKHHGPIKLPPLTINGVAINVAPVAIARRV
jgi:excinuclease UvrABC nuclease subunit